MNLADLLLAHRANALAAVEHRDKTAAYAAIEKKASRIKDAGAMDMLRNLGKKVTRVFEPTPAQKAINALKAQLPLDIQAIHKAVRSGATPKNPNLFANMKAVSDMVKNLPEEGGRGGTLKTLGGMGAFLALGASAEKAWETWKHHENLVAVTKDPQIPANQRVRATEVFNTLARYAPSIAKDQTFARDFTRMLIRHDAIDHKTVSDLISAEKMYNESKGQKRQFLDGLVSTGFKAMVS